MVSTAGQACCGHKVSGSAGGPGTTGNMNELSQEAQSKPLAAGNSWCHDQAFRRGHFVLSCTNHSPGRWHGHPEHLPEVQAWMLHPEGTGGEAHKDPLLRATITKIKLSQQQQLLALRISACDMCFTEADCWVYDERVHCSFTQHSFSQWGFLSNANTDLKLIPAPGFVS